MTTTPGYHKKFYSGLSGLQLPIPKYLFPPPYENVSRLTYYASFFNSIEFNSSFYKVPQPGTVTKWAASVPDEFRFTFKLWKEITHNKFLNFNEEDIPVFFRSINAVKSKKGCLLLQLPPGCGRENIHQLEHLFICIMESNPLQEWKIAVEFRNTSWYHEDVYDLLNLYKAALVIHDIPRSATPLSGPTSRFLYIRYHGPTGNYRGSYSEDFLRESAALIKEYTDEEKTVFAYFNNTMGEAFDNLKMLNACVSNNPH